MKLLKYSITTFLLVLLAFSASSCSSSNDDYIKEAYLDFSTEEYTIVPSTERDGIWEADVTFYLNDIYGLGSYDKLTGLNVIQSSFELLLYDEFSDPYFEVGDYVRIDLVNNNGSPLYLDYEITQSRINSLYVDDYSSAFYDERYYHFVRAFFDRLYRDGSVRLSITVNMVDYRDRPIVGQGFDLYFLNDLDLYIRG